MITPEEIKQLALTWWKPFLRGYILNEPLFPREISRIGKAKPGDITHRFDALQNEVSDLYSKSKNETGAGYWVTTAENNFRRTGSHEPPDSVVFQTMEDYLDYTRKKTEWLVFTRNYSLVIKQLPQLQPWAIENPLCLTTTDTDWAGIIAVCRYFLSSPRPELYIRQLPIPVHTKFIEENDTLLQPLLDFLIPDHIRDSAQKKFAERYFLQRDEPLIRLRMLDENLAIIHGISDLNIRLSDFERAAWDIFNVVITENKMNFLALPPLPSAMAIWSGGGFKVSYLRNARWLEGKNIYYWGDIDEHGFQILHQLRSYHPQSRSILMDIQTFTLHQDAIVVGEPNNAEKLNLLDPDEASLYELLKSMRPKNRLGQEKIPQEYADTVLISG